MNIFVLTINTIEDCDDAYVQVGKCGTLKECKDAARSKWNALAKDYDIGEFDEKENYNWEARIEDYEDAPNQTIKLEIHRSRIKIPASRIKSHAK